VDRAGARKQGTKGLLKKPSSRLMDVETRHYGKGRTWPNKKWRGQWHDHREAGMSHIPGTPGSMA